MTTPRMLTDWETVTSLLPEGWEALANDYKQLEVQYGNAKIRTADDLLRLILVHAAGDLPLRQTVALTAQAGGPQVSPMRLHKKMARAGGYLHALVKRMLHEPIEAPPEKWAGYDVLLTDATVVSRPGSPYGDARIHTLMRVNNLEYVQVLATDVHIGETLRHFSFAAEQLVVADRGYSNAASIFGAVLQGAAVLVRLNRGALPLRHRDGTAVEILPTLRELKALRAEEKTVLLEWVDASKDRHTVTGRLVMQRLPAAEAGKARKRALQEHGSNTTPEMLEAAGYVVLFTTVPQARLSATRCLELYRLRWQIELLFKRWKSLCNFDKMPNFLPTTILSWLYAKILAAMLLDRMASLPGEVSPPEHSQPAAGLVAEAA
jgi:hypothetical protein